MTRSVFLIVVDNPAHRVLFNRYLQSTPHHLVYAADGEDGFDRFSEVKPDVVIIHTQVARLDGTVLCRLIRQQPMGDRTPIVLMADEAEGRTEGWARTVGADAFLVTPFTRAAMMARVAPLLAEGRPTDEPAADEAAEAQPRSAHVSPDRLELLDRTEGNDLRDALQEEPTGHGMPHDMDTVVSFQNPFFEGERSGIARVDSHIGDDDPPTPVQDPREAEPKVGVARVDSELGEEPPTPREAARQEDEPATEAPPVDAEPPTEAVPRAAPPRDATPVVDRLEAPEIPEPSVARPDPLEEPRISPSESGQSPALRSKSELIEEPPREGTPSASDNNRVSAIRQRAVGKERRGLDESQLGKRLAKRVRRMYEGLDAVDYYALLGVEPSADARALQSAYFDLSLEFHPDRFFLLRSGDLKEKIYFIYRRIHEAYAVLCDDQRRAGYDQMLAEQAIRRVATDDLPSLEPDTGALPLDGDRLVVEGQTRETESLLTRAQQAYASGDYNAARLHLHLARAYEADNQTIENALRVVVKRLSPTL